PTAAPSRASAGASSWSYGGVKAGGSASSTRTAPYATRVAMLVRTWNLFHGRPSPPRRRAFLRQMIELVTRDRPDVVCLQELPVWALRHLEHWSGMHAKGAVSRRPLLPFGARAVTSLHHGLLRS